MGGAFLIMRYTYNEDKYDDCAAGVSYGQATDVVNDAGVTEPVSLVDVKAYMKMEDDYDDALITVLIKAARRIVEQYTNTNCTSRAVTCTLNNDNGGTYLPYGPVYGAVTGTDADGNTVEVVTSGTKWKQLISPRGIVTLSYTGGYPTCPDDFVDAIKAQVVFLYENRGDGTTGLSPMAQMILNTVRRV